VGIGFAYPLAWLLALPVLWLLWRSRRPDVETHVVSNLFLWVDGPAAPVPPASSRRLPPWRTWLRVAVLLAIVAAIAGPRTISARADAALLVDLSASMSARDGGGSRIEDARAAARAWLRRQRAGARVAIITAGHSAEVIRTVSAGSAAAQTAIGNLEATDASGGLDTGVALARQVADGPVAVVTDRPSPALAVMSGIEWMDIGHPADNIAITALESFDASHALVEVTNFGAAVRDVTLTVTGLPSAWLRRLSLGPSEAQGFNVAVAAGTTLTATVRDVDAAGNAIVSDDTRSAVITPAPPIRIRLDAPMDAPLVTALRAMSDVVILPAGRGESADVRVCAECGLTGELPSLAVNTTARAGNSLGLPTIGIDHPVLASVDFGDAMAPVVMAGVTGGTRQVVVHMPAGIVWTTRPAFPILMANAVDWLCARSTNGLSAARAAQIAESDLGTNRASPVELMPTAARPSARTWRVLAWLALFGVAVDLVSRSGRPWVRGAGAIALIIALAGWALPVGSTARTVAVAIDGSASMGNRGPAITARAMAEAEAMRPGDRIASLRFGGSAAPATSFSDHLTRTAGESGTYDATNIAAALRAAQISLPADGDRRVTLISDGRPTTGDALAEARRIGALGIPIDVVPVDARGPAFIADVDAPPSAPAGGTVPVQIWLAGRAGDTTRLDVTRNGVALASRRVQFGRDGRATLVVDDVPPQSGMQFYRATVADEQTGVTISENGAATLVDGPTRVLIVSDRPGAFSAIIKGDGLTLSEVAPAEVGISREALSGFSAIVLDGVAPHRFTGPQRDAISAAVTADGAGLLLLGSPDSLNASEFGPSPFSEALPIDFTTLPRPPSAGASLALLVDISGSMAATGDGITKIAAAREAIQRALAVIPRSDAVEVIGFSATPRVLIGPAASRDPAAVTQALNAIVPSGSTALAPAVDQAADWLRSTPNTRRRILLVTDGRTSLADAEAVRSAMRGRDIEVSVVTIGQDAEREWLAQLAASTGGRAVSPSVLTDLARLVAREASRGASGREITEHFTVRAGTHPLSPGNPLPALDGYVAGRLRDGASAAWKSQTDDPVLAAWPRGLGRVAVFASDLSGAWGAPLARWPHTSAFWRQTIRWLARGTDGRGIDAEFSTTLNGPQLTVIGPLRATDATETLSRMRAVIRSPSGSERVTPLFHVAPSRWVASVALGETGEYRAVLDPTTGDDSRRTIRGWYWNGDREAIARGVNIALLQEIAQSTGGRVRPEVGAAVAPDQRIFAGPRRRHGTDATLWLLFAALACLVYDYLNSPVEIRS
jgi:Mg-chelatase subunit ChlD